MKFPSSIFEMILSLAISSTESSSERESPPVRGDVGMIVPSTAAAVAAVQTAKSLDTTLSTSEPGVLNPPPSTLTCSIVYPTPGTFHNKSNGPSGIVII